KTVARSDTNSMKQAPGELGGWRWAFLLTGLVSLLMVALPAQAGLGDLLDDLLDPEEDIPVVGDIVEPVAADVVDPIVEDLVEPVGGDLVDPVVNEVLTPTATTAVPPAVDDTTTPVPDVAGAPVAETAPVRTITTTTISVIESDQVEAARESETVATSSSGYPGGVLVADTTATSGEGLIAIRSRAPLAGLETALALQTTLVGSSVTRLSDLNVSPPDSENRVEANWLSGLTGWLRNGASELVNVLALPIRLLEVLARALITAGSGLIAPLSMLLAFTALLIKDRRWLRAVR
ncbi:MAG TPA: hypothetical protein VJQ79_13960, partial [Acidimicrobiia bacterium]|nr:hypothetical protein [Acidimicrobiia bacterium]